VRKLRAEIEAVRADGFAGFAGWSIPRVTDYFGRFLRHGNAYPDRLVRLFDRRRGGWHGNEIHENTKVEGTTGASKGSSRINRTASLTDHQQRMQNYAELMAQALYKKGKRVGLLKVWDQSEPGDSYADISFALGFLDGWRGLMFADRRDTLRASEVSEAVLETEKTAELERISGARSNRRASSMLSTPLASRVDPAGVMSTVVESEQSSYEDAEHGGGENDGNDADIESEQRKSRGDTDQQPCHSNDPSNPRGHNT